MSVRPVPSPALAFIAVLGACAPVEPPASGASGSAPTESIDEDAAGPCIDEEPRLIHYARRLAADPDPRLDAIKRRYHLEDADASDVRQVTDPVICARAGSAYADALDLADPPDAVAVIRIGDRYVVTSRVGGSTSAELASAVVLDEALRVDAAFRR
ncbi:MAG: hypothetical protein ACOC9N_02080 [Gemmatimonadota bacterium]